MASFPLLVFPFPFQKAGPKSFITKCPLHVLVTERSQSSFSLLLSFFFRKFYGVCISLRHQGTQFTKEKPFILQMPLQLLTQSQSAEEMAVTQEGKVSVFPPPASLSHSTPCWGCETKRIMGFSYPSSGTTEDERREKTSGKEMECQLCHYGEGRGMTEMQRPFR